jgi:uncharacterized protein (TIGR02001 family)
MRNLRILAALGLIATAGMAQAEVSGTAAIVSDYDFRGITQTGEQPALQLSIDYANESGWYIGTWGSNIDQFSDGGINTASTEVDVYTGFRGTAGDLGWDAGLTYYTYNGASDLNFPEIYAKLSYSIVSGGVYYSNAFGHKDNGSAFYVYGDVGIPAGPLTIGLHAGLSSGDGIEDTYGFGADENGEGAEDSYTDYGIGISYSANNFTLGMKWIAVDAGDGGSDDRIVLSVSTAFPWGE